MNCERENIEEALRKDRMDERELICEILPLLKDNLLAVCRMGEDGISMRFLNGQKATVAVWFDRETAHDVG